MLKSLQKYLKNLLKKAIRRLSYIHINTQSYFANVMIQGYWKSAQVIM